MDRVCAIHFDELPYFFFYKISLYATSVGVPNYLRLIFIYTLDNDAKKLTMFKKKI